MPDHGSEASARKKARAVALVCVFNFIAFWLIAIFIGGDAYSGKSEAGKYYLSLHGNYTEVSFWVYCYSWAHMVLAFVGIPVAAIAGLGWLVNHRSKAGGEKRND